ncbi:hypothetical protein SGRA_3317 [Saprospira grandis str. Lewin]|uniref:Uncharacterized protein n=1 Tax=Saprospira grandis (strain Lewin) TaxID=984262 RepID=H6L108_SAPGL|nr:hypothetical protein SGRA_3317 [Saprospira grandis str. Lewin]
MCKGAAGPFGLAMCSSGPQGQTEPAKLAKGRANSELRNVAPQGEAAAEAPNHQQNLLLYRAADVDGPKNYCPRGARNELS